MLPRAHEGLDTQLKELRSKSAHDWAAARFFAATTHAAVTATPQHQRASRWRLAAKISAVVALLIWAASAVLGAKLPPTFALPFLLVAIGSWVGGTRLAGHKLGSSTRLATREDLV